MQLSDAIAKLQTRFQQLNELFDEAERVMNGLAVDKFAVQRVLDMLNRLEEARTVVVGNLSMVVGVDVPDEQIRTLLKLPVPEQASTPALEAAEQPEAQAEEDKQPKKEVWYIAPRARRILRETFKDGGDARTLLEALEKTYSTGLASEVMPITTRGGLKAVRRLDDPWSQGVLLTSLRNGVDKLEAVRGQRHKNVKLDQRLWNLFRELVWVNEGPRIANRVRSWEVIKSVEPVKEDEPAVAGEVELSKQRAKKTKKWGIDQIPSKIIRKAFQNGQAPSSLQQALEYTYGTSLSNQIIMVPSGGNKTTMQKLPLLEAAQNTNVIQTRLGHMLKKLVSIKEDRVPEGIVVDDKLMNLFMAIEFRTKGEEIVSTMKQWGIFL